jgi:hypothetical protein
VVNNDLSDVTKTKAELLDEFWSVLNAQDEAIRNEFLRLKAESEKRGLSRLSARKGVRQLVQNLPRGVKDTLKGSRLLRTVSEAVVGHAIAASGDDHGFANLAELCGVMEDLVGGVEPFVKKHSLVEA